VVRIRAQVPLTTELQIHDRVLGEQGEHVVEEGNARSNGSFAPPVNLQRKRDAGFFGHTANFRPSDLHLGTS
jgi:hypothetical protein